MSLVFITLPINRTPEALIARFASFREKGTGVAGEEAQRWVMKLHLPGPWLIWAASKGLLPKLNLQFCIIFLQGFQKPSVASSYPQQL